MSVPPPSQPTEPSRRRSRRRRKRVKSSVSQMKRQFSWDGPGSDNSYLRRHRWGLIILGSDFLLTFLLLGYITYTYYGKFLKTPSRQDKIKQVELPEPL